MAPTLRLRPVRPNDRQAALSAHDALVADDFDFLLSDPTREPWAAFLERLDSERVGVALPPGRVPATFLLAELRHEPPGAAPLHRSTVVGRVSIRHELNSYLAAFGGHIGYAVVPAHRRRGHGTEILRQALVVARSVGVDRVLVTCDDDNEASWRIIERCGGALESIVDEPGAASKRRYWID